MPDDVPVRDKSQIRMLRAVMRANAAFRNHYKESMAKKVGLSMTEFDFIAGLGNTGGLRMSDLAQAMITTPSNVTRICAAMEKKGIAVRERSSESDREVIAKLTREGQKLFDEVFRPVVDWTIELMDRNSTPSEQIAVAETLERLVKDLTDKR